MAVLTNVSHEEVGQLLTSYPAAPLTRIEAIAAGSVNSNFAVFAGNAMYFLRVYEEQPFECAAAEVELLAHLGAQGVPTPPPVRRLDGQAVSTLADKPAVLFAWNDGAMRCQASVSERDASRIGEALARVHMAGAGAARPPGRFDLARLARERLPVIARDAAHGGQAEWIADAVARTEARRDRSLPRGLIHGDLFRDNVLWNADGSIAALLDFESASDGAFAYDVMVTALAWCVGDELDARLVRALLGGYDAVRPLSDAERAALFAEGCAAALRFTMTRLTDYAIRVTDGPRVVKDWRRFQKRFAALEALGEEGVVRLASG